MAESTWPPRNGSAYRGTSACRTCLPTVGDGFFRPPNLRSK